MDRGRVPGEWSGIRETDGFQSGHTSVAREARQGGGSGERDGAHLVLMSFLSLGVYMFAFSSLMDFYFPPLYVGYFSLVVFKMEHFVVLFLFLIGFLFTAQPRMLYVLSIFLFFSFLLIDLFVYSSLFHRNCMIRTS